MRVDLGDYLGPESEAEFGRDGGPRGDDICPDCGGRGFVDERLSDAVMALANAHTLLDDLGIASQDQDGPLSVVDRVALLAFRLRRVAQSRATRAEGARG